MREAKRSRSGWSNRTVPKSKRTNASHSFIRNQFLGQFNKKHGITLGIILFLVIGIPLGYVFYQSPAFHSYGQSSGPLDPVTLLWRANAPNSDLSEFKNINSIYNSGCANAGTINCVGLHQNSTQTAIALTKVSVGDLSVGAGKSLMFQFNWLFDGSGGGTWTNGNSWGYYLTTNNTLPLTHNYDPAQDPNVLYQVKIVCSSSPCTPSSQSLYTEFVYALRTLGIKDTIDAERIGNTCSISASTSCYMNVLSGGGGFLTNGATNTAIAQQFLNTTGTGIGGGNCTSGPTGFTGPGCSQEFIGTVSFAGASTRTLQFTQLLPFFSFSTQQYYLGFYSFAGNTANVQFTFDQFTSTSPDPLGTPSTSANMNIGVYLPIAATQQPQPTFDSGGWFGPIGKWFINGAIFIWQNIINFFSYLATILSPVLAGVIALFSGVFIAIFNALGGIFGDPTLGNDIGTFFSNLASYFANIFGLAITIITGIAGPNGLLANAVQIAINFLSGSNNFIGVLVTLATGLAGLIPVLSGFWTLLVTLFNTGIAGADFIIIIMLVLLEFAAITDWIQDDNPIDALVAIPLAFFLFYFLANAPSSINIIALNTSVSSNYLTAWNNIVWFIKLFPVIFFAIFFEWASSLDETARFHRQTTILHNFFSVIKFYRLLTVDVVMGSWWFFDNAYDMITKGITAIKGRWSPVEVAGTG